MDTEQIERMAREAGFDVEGGEITLDRVLTTGDAPDQRAELERFASLVRAAALEEAANVCEQTVCGGAHNVTVWGHPAADAIRQRIKPCP